MAEIKFIDSEGNEIIGTFPTDASARRYAQVKKYVKAYRNGFQIFPLCPASEREPKKDAL